ncbi:MAG: DUF1028 domain-containing protein [Sulfolobales archaeon]
MESGYRVVATFSIVAADPSVGDVGVGVASKFLAVGHIVPWAETEVGAVATQAWANVRFGPKALQYLRKGLKPENVLEKLISGDPRREHRQIGIVNARGESAAYTGSQCLPYAGHIKGDGYTVQGNMIVGQEVLEAMAKAFETTRGELVDKILAALEAGDKAGGDRRGKQSAAILVLRRCGGYGGCREGVDKYVDIRVDDHQEPVQELKRIFKLWEAFLLRREPETELYEWDQVWKDIARALIKLNYLHRMPRSPSSRTLYKAFERWAAENNLENKIRRDKKIWKSVYKYIIEVAGIE